jgi:hypothetical protein
VSNHSVERRDQLLKSIAMALGEIEKEIGKASLGLQALDGPRQLQFIRSRLCEMQSILSRDDWGDIPKSKPDIARLVIDTWPLRDPLRDRLCQIEYDYLRLK